MTLLGGELPIMLFFCRLRNYKVEISVLLQFGTSMMTCIFDNEKLMEKYVQNLLAPCF